MNWTNPCHQGAQRRFEKMNRQWPLVKSVTLEVRREGLWLRGKEEPEPSKRGEAHWAEIGGWAGGDYSRQKKPWRRGKPRAAFRKLLSLAVAWSVRMQRGMVRDCHTAGPDQETVCMSSCPAQGFLRVSSLWGGSCNPTARWVYGQMCLYSSGSWAETGPLGSEQLLMLKSVCQEDSAVNTSYSQEVKRPCCSSLVEALRSHCHP